MVSIFFFSNCVSICIPLSFETWLQALWHTQLNFEYTLQIMIFFMVWVSDVNIDRELVDQNKIILPHETDFWTLRISDSQREGYLGPDAIGAKIFLKNLEELYNKRRKRCECTEQTSAVHSTKIFNFSAVRWKLFCSCFCQVWVAHLPLVMMPNQPS